MAFELKELVIDRSKWGRGALLNADGTMCCLAFAAEACGVEHSHLRQSCSGGNCLCGNPDCQVEVRIGLPTGLQPGDIEKLPPFLTNAVFCGEAAGANDDIVISQEERERRITELFAAEGCKVTFTGELK